MSDGKRFVVLPYPKVEPIKKERQLNQRLKEVQHALNNNYSYEKITNAVERYRLAKLSLLKAKLYWVTGMGFHKKPNEEDSQTLDSEIITWTEKPVDIIVQELGKVNNIDK